MSAKPAMVFVSAITANMPSFPGGARLFAFPKTPTRDGNHLVILDSGAYELSRRGRYINNAHIENLKKHYSRFEYAKCIAPDVYLDPQKTVLNWNNWSGGKIVPVIQFEKQKKLSLYAAIWQAEIYAQAKPDFVAISNPGLKAIESGEIKQICRTVREITGAKWLHNLGAGWSPRDIRDWRDLDCFDSIDTIAYYTDAQFGKRWRLDGGISNSQPKDWREIALQNSAVAQELCLV